MRIKNEGKEIENIDLSIKCHYCGQPAKYQFANGKYCCCKTFNSCPEMRKKAADNKPKPNNTFISETVTMKNILFFTNTRKGQFVAKNASGKIIYDIRQLGDTWFAFEPLEDGTISRKPRLKHLVMRHLSKFKLFTLLENNFNE